MIIIRDDKLFDGAFLALLAIVLGGLLLTVTLTKGPEFLVWSHRNDVRTVKNANYELIKKYTNDKQAHYIYKLDWEYSDKVEYADVRYESKSNGNGSHTYKRVNVVYSATEPTPDNVDSYNLDNVRKDKQKAERYDGPIFIPYFIPIR